MSTISVSRSPLKLVPLTISQKDKDKLNLSNQLMSERFNAQKIQISQEQEKHFFRIFYSPQSRKLPKINLTDSQLKFKNSNEIESLMGRSIKIQNMNLRKLHSLEHQHSDSVKYSNMSEANILDKELIKKQQSVQDNSSSLLQDSMMYPSKLKDSIIKSIDQDSKEINKIKIKQFKGYNSQLLTSIMDLPRKFNKNYADFSPKRVLQRNKDINSKSKSSDRKLGEHQKDSILQAYRYDRELIQLNDEQSKLHSINNKNKISKDLYTKMLIQYTQLQNLYTNQMKNFDKISEDIQKKIKEKDNGNNQYHHDYSEYGEYQAILEKFQQQQIIADDNIEFSRFNFEMTIFCQILNSLIEGCSYQIKEQLLFLQRIFSRIMYSNSNQNLHNYLYNLVQKPSFLEKPTTYQEGLLNLIEYIKEKDIQLNKCQQLYQEQVFQLEQKLKSAEEKVDRLTIQNKQFEEQRKSQEEEFKEKQQLLLDDVQQKRYLLESEIKKEKESLKIELAQMERDCKEKITGLQDIIVQKIEETQYYKNIYDKQEQRYSQLKIQYDILFENQAQSTKQMRLNSNNIKNLQDKLHFQDSQIRSITSKNGMKFQELTPRPSFKNVQILIEEYSKIIGQSNQSVNKLDKDLSEANKTNNINEVSSEENKDDIKNNSILQEQESTQAKVNEINDFIAQLIQKIKKQQQEIVQIQNTKVYRPIKQPK